jgi:hypothetical protein
MTSLAEQAYIMAYRVDNSKVVLCATGEFEYYPEKPPGKQMAPAGGWSRERCIEFLEFKDAGLLSNQRVKGGREILKGSMVFLSIILSNYYSK